MKTSRIIPRAGKSRELLTRFATVYRDDELESHCRGPVWNKTVRNHVLVPRLEIHHVFHAGSRKDLWHNLVRCTSRAHTDYAHREPFGGQIACMAAVLNRKRMFVEAGRRKTDDVEEYRADVMVEWCELWKDDPIGWLEGERDAGRVPEHYLPTVEFIVGAFQ